MFRFFPDQLLLDEQQNIAKKRVNKIVILIS